MFPHADGEVLDDELVIIHSPDSEGKPKVFEPYTKVGLAGVSSDIGGWSEALWEQLSRCDDQRLMAQAV